MADPVTEQIAALSDEDWAVREDAASALATLRDPRAVAPLTRALRDSDRAVREAAKAALFAIGEPAVPALGDCLDDPALQVQEAASSVLAEIADYRVFDALVAALRSGDWIVRMHAAKALGRIRDPSAVAFLMPLLQDKVKAVREQVTASLAAIGDSAVSPLLQALEHDEWLIRLHAVEALGKLKSADAVEPLLRAALVDEGKERIADFDPHRIDCERLGNRLLGDRRRSGGRRFLGMTRYGARLGTLAQLARSPAGRSGEQCERHERQAGEQRQRAQEHRRHAEGLGEAAQLIAQRNASAPAHPALGNEQTGGSRDDQRWDLAHQPVGHGEDRIAVERGSEIDAVDCDADHKPHKDIDRGYHQARHRIALYELRCAVHRAEKATLRL